ncbi:MAG TPA: hypothetical protein VGL99_15480 [Chloroflexota bacterium]
MAWRIQQITPANGWYAVFVRTGGAIREHTGPSRPTSVGTYRSVGPLPEFLPLVAWALVVEDTGSTSSSSRVVGVVVDEDKQARAVLSLDDPSFLAMRGRVIPASTAPD